jgi:hypothetical protein
LAAVLEAFQRRPKAGARRVERELGQYVTRAARLGRHLGALPTRQFRVAEFHLRQQAMSVDGVGVALLRGAGLVPYEERWIGAVKTRST